MESTTGVAPFRLQANLIVVDVEVNGRSGQFLLDTGAGATCLGRDFAEKVGVAPVQKEVGCGAGGDVGMEMARLEHLRVAGLEDEDATCLLMDLDGLRQRIGPDIDGILGFDFLGKGVLTIDYPGQRVRIDRAASPVSAPAATVEGRQVRLRRAGFALSLPSDGWKVETDTPLPTIPVVLENGRGAKVTVQEVESHGLTFEMAAASMDASLPAKVSEFRLIAQGARERAGCPTQRVEYFGASEGSPRRYVTEALLTDRGLLVVTCEVPTSGDGGFEAVQGELESILASVTVATA